MNNEVFERLLYEEEGTTIDFKKEQYRFVKATEQEKSELLKDILGFANAWRRSEAYILVGVEEVRGGRGKVVGISAKAHLDDHALQQFVNNLTNRPVRFQYEALGFEGKQVGIIRIEEQTRPIYLRRDYGKLTKDEVYVRRGSSTDPTKPASPDEISQMHVGPGHLAAELAVEFAEIERDGALGTHLSWDAEFCEMPARDSVPDLLPRRQSGPFGIDLSALEYSVTSRLNDDYFRELADYEFARRLLRPIRLVVRNVGHVAANNVRVEMAVPASAGVLVIRPSRVPGPPKRRKDSLVGLSPKAVGPAVRRREGAADIVENDERVGVVIDCGHLQPGRRIWSDVLYVGKADSGEVALQGLILADNLPQPKDFTLTVSVSVTKKTMTVDELCSLPDAQLRGG